MEIKTGGRENGQTVYNAIKFIKYLETLEIGKMYGIQKCCKGITVLTKNEVITKKLFDQKIEEKIIELKKIANNSSDIIEREIEKGMAACVVLLKKDLLGDENIE